MGMKSRDRQQAERIAAYVDGVVIGRRCANRPSEPVVADDRELGGLQDLVQTLGECRVDAPDTFGQSLLRRLPTLEREAARRTTPIRLRLERLAYRARSVPADGILRAIRAAIQVAAAVGVILVLGRGILSHPVASASEILSRSDEALTKLVRRDQILYRQWKVTVSRISPQGQDLGTEHRTIHEWMDGGDFDRVAGRWYSDNDRLFIAYTTLVQPGGQHRAHVYFSPGAFGEARGLLNIEPTRAEFAQAVESFAADQRGPLRLYLDRQYLYVPIAGERRFNRAALDAATVHDATMPRTVVSLDDAPQSARDESVYRVRIVDPVSVTFNWRAAAPPRVQLKRSETIRSIDRDSYLSVRMEQTDWVESGRQRMTSSRLVEMRTLDAKSVSSDPFTLDVPDGTLLERQSAREMLTALQAAFQRLPEFSSMQERNRSSWTVDRAPQP